MTEREAFEAQVRADVLERVEKVAQRTAADWRKHGGPDTAVAALLTLTTLPSVNPAFVAAMTLDIVALVELLARALDKVAALEKALAELAPPVDLRK